jgi:hypothetical protein
MSDNVDLNILLSEVGGELLQERSPVVWARGVYDEVTKLEDRVEKRLTDLRKLPPEKQAAEKTSIRTLLPRLHDRLAAVSKAEKGMEKPDQFRHHFIKQAVEEGHASLRKAIDKIKHLITQVEALK